MAAYAVSFSIGDTMRSRTQAFHADDLFGGEIDRERFSILACQLRVFDT